MPRARLPIVAALTAAAVLALIACGGDNDEANDYVDQVNDVTSTLNTGLAEIGSQGSALASPADASRVFTDFSEQLQTAAADVSAISAPDDVSGLHDQLVKQLEQLSSEAKNAADEISDGGPAAIAGVATQFISEANSLSAAADATIAEINAQLQE